MDTTAAYKSCMDQMKKAFDANWNEGEHPRLGDGKFVPKTSEDEEEVKSDKKGSVEKEKPDNDKEE